VVNSYFTVISGSAILVDQKDNFIVAKWR